MRCPHCGTPGTFKLKTPPYVRVTPKDKKHMKNTKIIESLCNHMLRKTRMRWCSACGELFIAEGNKVWGTDKKCQKTNSNSVI